MIDTATQPPAMKGTGRISSALPSASPNWWVRAMRRFTRNRVSMTAAGILVGICLLSVFAPVVTPHSPAKQYRKEGLKGGMPVGPSAQFLLGTDSNGRDMFTRLLYGGRAAFLVGVVASALAVSTGVAIGSFAGISGGWVDMLLMRVVDVALSLPTLFIILMFVAISKPGLGITILVIALIGWANRSRARISAQTLAHPGWSAKAPAMWRSSSRMAQSPITVRRGARAEHGWAMPFTPSALKAHWSWTNSRVCSICTAIMTVTLISPVNHRFLPPKLAG